MAKKKLSYWIQRAIDEEELMQRALDLTEKKILNAHLKGQKYLEDQIKKIYNRYLNKSDLAESDVKKILNTSAKVEDLQELQLMARTIEDKEIRKQVRDYLTGLSVKYRISVLEDLKAKSYIVAKQIADVELNTSTDFYIDVIKQAHEQASAEAIIGKTEQVIAPVIKPSQYVSYRSGNVIQLKKLDTDEVVRSIKVTPDIDIPEFKELSTKYVKNILEKNWKGSNYSKRIWSDTDALAEKLEELFTVKQMTGMSDSEMVKELQAQFQVSAGVARRLIRTESNYVANQAKLKGWRDHGVEKYIYIAVLDLRTSKTCQSLDGGIYNTKDAVVGENFPPAHPNCRSTVAAYFGERTLNGRRTANDPITGKTLNISQRTNYKEWEKAIVAKHSKEELDLFRLKVKNLKSDNQQFRRYKAVLKEGLPNTLDDFQNIKYGDKTAYNRLKERYRSVKGNARSTG